MTIELNIEPLTAEAFAPFGEVIAPEHAKRVYPINQGTCTRFHDLAGIEVDAPTGRVVLSLFRAAPRGFPITIDALERHPLGSQAFIPLSKEPYLVVVAAHEHATPRCFLASHGQGVNYHRNTWHHPLLALHCESDFWVIDRAGPGDNCDERAWPSTCIRRDPTQAS